jgi:peptide-methionine (S)-S-oxide reductase
LSEREITLGGGCFWCLEAVYEHVDGVTAVESGYCNGHVPSAQLRAGLQRPHRPCRGGAAALRRRPHHAAEVLEIFFTVHDPTTLNRQGNDVGTQYRSGIYWTRPGAGGVAREVLAGATGPGGAGGHRTAAGGQLLAGRGLPPALLRQPPGQGYCAFVVAPKVEKFRRSFAARYRP